MRSKTEFKYPAMRLIQLFPVNTTASFLSDVFGVTRTTVIRWRNRDCMLDDRRADEYAVKMGKHPFEIWPEWFDDYKDKQ